MTYVAVYRAFLRTAPAVVATASALGTWLRLQGYAVELEQRGAIPGCKSWPARAWMSTAMVTPEELAEAVTAGLCQWRDDDLVVLGYDLEGQKKVEKKRSDGRLGGRPKKTEQEPNRNQVVNQVGNHLDNQVGSPSPFPSQSSPSQSHPTQPDGGGGNGPLLFSRNEKPKPDSNAEAEAIENEDTRTSPVWTQYDWLQQFKLAFRNAKGGFYGGGSPDAKATAELGDLLQALSEPDRLAAQRRAPAMFVEYFDDDSPVVVKARHCFMFFVTRWNGLRMPIGVAPEDRPRPIPPLPKAEPNARAKGRALMEAQERQRRDHERT